MIIVTGFVKRPETENTIYKTECPVCTAQIEFDVDSVESYVENHDTTVALVRCPHCGKMIDVSRTGVILDKATHVLSVVRDGKEERLQVGMYDSLKKRLVKTVQETMKSAATIGANVASPNWQSLNYTDELGEEHSLTLSISKILH